MKMLRVIFLIGVLLVGQASARAGNAFLVRNLRYHVMRGGYPMPARTLPVGAIVKVLAIHGAKAEIVTSSGDTVTVRLTYLHMVPDAPSPEPTVIQPPVVATPSLPRPSPSPNQPPVVATPPLPKPAPSPNQAGGSSGNKVSGTEPERPSETGKRSVPVRCSHLKKDGEQCSRMTTSPNGLCWQHGGN